MRTEEIVREVKFNMSTIGLNEKATPDEPIKVVTEEKTLYKCPCCATILVEQYDTVKRGHIAKFCENCGKALSNEGGV